MISPEEELRALIEQLIPLGEDETEMQFWEDLFDSLSPEEQTSILENLRTELASLKANRGE